MNADPTNAEPTENGADGRYESPLRGPDRLIAAVKQVTDLSEWSAGIIGAGAAAILAATPLLSGFEYETRVAPVWRWAFAVLAAAASVAAATWAIATLAHLRRPVVTTLDDLPTEFAELIAKNPRTYLPDDDIDLNAFRASLDGWGQAAGRVRHEAKADPNDSQKQLVADWAETQYDTYLRTRDRIILEGALRAKLTLTSLPWHLYLAVVIVVVGLVSYVIVLSGKEPDPKPQVATPAILLQYPTTYDEVLSGCDTTSEDASSTEEVKGPGSQTGIDGLPVLLTKGTGTSDDPWIFQTFGHTTRCPAATISGRSDDGFAIVSLNSIAVSTTTSEPPNN